jgi:hypothetical protein
VEGKPSIHRLLLETLKLPGITELSDLYSCPKEMGVKQFNESPGEQDGQSFSCDCPRFLRGIHCCVKLEFFILLLYFCLESYIKGYVECYLYNEDYKNSNS